MTVKLSYLLVLAAALTTPAILAPIVRGTTFLWLYLAIGILLILFRKTFYWRIGQALIIFEAIGISQLFFGLIHGLHKFGYLILMMVAGILLFVFVEWAEGRVGFGNGRSGYGCGGCGSSGCGGGCGGCGGCGG